VLRLVGQIRCASSSIAVDEFVMWTCGIVRVRPSSLRV